MVKHVVRTVSNGKEWRRIREEGVIIHLPSGNFARIRSIDISTLIALGRVPDTLTGVVAKLLDGEDVTVDKKDTANLKVWIELADVVCKHVFLEPRIVDDPLADDEISIEDLIMEDKFFAVQFLNVPAKELEKFSQQQARDMESVHPGENNLPEAEPTPAA